MAIIKKDEGKDNTSYLVIIDKEFKATKSGKAVVAEIKLCFPKEFVKTSKDGKHQYVSINADKVLDFVLIEKDAA
ncbi:MAG: hypothetical protein LBS76_05070 [Mycoplasmataceae bacterium]|nr:hypothetical protein [Mycoplasmataceae bacterium]